MSEQRFICGMGFTNADVNFYNPIRIIHDNENDKDYYLFADLCKIMNEQQDTITKQKEKVARVLNEYSRQFKRHSKEFSFMLDLAEDLGVKKLEAKDD